MLKPAISGPAAVKRGYLLRAACGLSAAATVLAMSLPCAGAQESPNNGSEAPQSSEAEAGDATMAELLEKVGAVAQQVSAKNEEVKQLEDTLSEHETQLAEFQLKAQDATQRADVAAQAVVNQQSNVNGIAQSRYRGVHFDPLTTTLASGSAQEAVERLGYMGALSRDAHRNLTTMSKTSRKAEAARREADSAVAEAEAKKRDLETRRTQLVAEKQALEAQQAAIKEQVDALDPVQRQFWEKQFGPSGEVDEKLLEALKASGMGGVAAEAALTRTGSPYDWGATGPDRFDCSGLMYWAYQQQGKTIPRTSQAQLAGGTPVPIDKLEPGDIVGYYAGVTHVGMYIGNGQVVHAATYGVPVQVVPVDSMPIQGAVRY